MGHEHATVELGHGFCGGHCEAWGNTGQGVWVGHCLAGGQEGAGEAGGHEGLLGQTQGVHEAGDVAVGRGGTAPVVRLEGMRVGATILVDLGVVGVVVANSFLKACSTRLTLVKVMYCGHTRHINTHWLDRCTVDTPDTLTHTG